GERSHQDSRAADRSGALPNAEALRINMEITRRDFVAGPAAVFVGRPFQVRPEAERPAVKPSSSDLAYLSLSDAAALIKRRRLSPVELTQAMLDRIDRLNGRTGAFLTITRELAIDAARMAEQEIARGRYRG